LHTASTMTVRSWMGPLLVALTAFGCDSGKGQSTGADGGPDAAADGAPADKATADVAPADKATADVALADKAADMAAGDAADGPGSDTAPTDGGDARPAGCPGGCPAGSVCVIPLFFRGEYWGECTAIPAVCRPEAGGDVGSCNQCVGGMVCHGAYGCLAGGYNCGI
jgi:hypothetical protein